MNAHKVALVQDWLTGMRGGEKVLEVLCEQYPTATLFTLLHNEGAMSDIIERMEIRTSFIQNLPFKEERYRNYLPLFPPAIDSLDFSEYDLIISSSHCVAKGAKPREGALHICYCHTPMRYAWEMYDEYFGRGRAGLSTRIAMSFFRKRLQEWDVRSSDRVHYFVANSENVARRIQSYYGRDSEVIHAPVDCSLFTASDREEGYYLIVSALVPYKRVDLAIEAVQRLGERLVIVGTGPESEKLKRSARPTTEFLGWQEGAQLAKLYAGCKALIFPGVEDFGIVPLEAMASGKPVIAFGKGGALETVIDRPEGGTGIFFYDQTVDALIGTLRKLGQYRFDPKFIRKHAEKFDRSVFQEKIKRFINDRVEEHFSA
jgi:glycosyltransferase involved in cell wall biosynthesis